MNKEIETRNIFVDTSIFVKENFFLGNKLKAFINHSKKDEIDLYTTEITIRESLSKIDEFFSISKNVLNKSLRELSNKAKILKNIESIEALFIMKEDFDEDEELKKLKEKFDEFIRGNFYVIPIDSSKTEKIINDYFEKLPPFKDGKKKYEFPDSFVLNSIETWSRKRNEIMYVVSDDEDMLSYKSKILRPIKEYDKLLNQISFTYSEDNIIGKVEESINNNEKAILERVEDEFVDRFPSDGFDSSFGYEYSLINLTDVTLELYDYSIISIIDDKAIVELSIDGSYSAEVSYEDVSVAFYDKEDGTYYGAETIETKISDTVKLTSYVNVYIDFPGNPVIWEWDADDIPDGIPDIISLEN